MKGLIIICGKLFCAGCSSAEIKNCVPSSDLAGDPADTMPIFDGHAHFHDSVAAKKIAYENAEK